MFGYMLLRMTSKIKIPRKTKLATSAEVVNSIDDLLMLIFLRLPVKSLMCFKLVSKRWKSLITSPDFRLLRNPEPSAAVGLFYPVRKRCEFEYIHFDFKAPINPPFRKLIFPDEDSECFWISQSCNGLLVCCGSKGYMHKGGKFAVKKCCIYNPTTNQFRKIPTPSDENGKGVHGVYLAFDSAKSPPYKVICVRWTDISHRTLQILKHSAESGLWSVSGEPFVAGVNFDYAVYWNDAIHWISFVTCNVLYFNVNQETLGWIPGPTDGWKTRKLEYFGVSCDHLHLIESNHTQGTILIYEMERDHSKWVVKYQVDLSIAATAYPHMAFYPDIRLNRIAYDFSIYSLVRGEEVEDSFLVLQISKKIIRFNIKCSTFEEIFDFEGTVVDGWYTFDGPLALEYIESVAYA